LDTKKDISAYVPIIFGISFPITNIQRCRKGRW